MLANRANRHEPLRTTESKAFFVALRRYNLRSGKDIARLDPRSLLIVFSRAFEQISVRARECDADLEQRMFDETLNGDPEADPVSTLASHRMAVEAWTAEGG